MKKLMVVFCSVLVFTAIAALSASAANVEVSLGGEQLTMNYQGGPTVLSKAKSAADVKLPTGEAWKASFAADKKTLSVSEVSGQTKFYFPNVAIAVQAGQQLSVQLNEKGWVTEIDYPGNNGPLFVFLPDGGRLEMEIASRVSFLFMADGTMKITVVSGNVKYRDSKGKLTVLSTGQSIFVAGFSGMPAWRTTEATGPSASPIKF